MKKYFIYSRREPVFQKEVILFRKKFHYSGSGRMVIGITADTVYLLYINGQYVCRGPESGDAYRKYYDEPDITAFLQPGENCIGVKVIHYPAGDEGIQQFAFGPTGLVRSAYGGLCVFDREERGSLHTDTDWKCRPDPSYGFKPSKKAKQAGDMELIHAEYAERDWTEADYDDSSWQNAVIVQEADEKRPASAYGVLANWMLRPRDIPLAEETQISCKALQSSPEVNFDGLLQGQPVQIPLRTQVVCVMDMGQLVTAYVESDFGQGGGAEVAFLYSECYYRRDGNKLIKGRRDDWENGVLDGETDELKLGEGSFIYEPFAYRTFRYLRITICTGEKEAVLNGLKIRQTGYPFHPRAWFQAENQVLEQIWQVSLHTLKCCMHDTYIDCPYYERLQYVMDTMLEALHTYPVLGDDRLARKAFLDFAGTQLPDGMIYCNAPANDRHVIPGFGIYYIDMLYQHYLYYGDKRTVKQYWPVCAGILGFFENHVEEESGLVGNCGYWEFADWTAQWNSYRGEPADRESGDRQYLYTMMYAYGLLRMAQLTEAVYGRDAARHWLGQHGKVKEAVNRTVWDRQAGYYRTSERAGLCSQHAQVWAVLSECIEGEDAGALMDRMLADTNLVKCSYPMKHYLNRALEKTGREEGSPGMWQEYETLLQNGVTTWPEDPVTARSDCHGWSTIPICEICHVLLGVRPAEPGFGAAVIEPGHWELGSMSGAVWTPAGMITVERQVKLQEAVSGRFYRVRLRFLCEKEMKLTVRIAGRELLCGFCKSGECRADIPVK